MSFLRIHVDNYPAKLEKIIPPSHHSQKILWYSFIAGIAGFLKFLKYNPFICLLTEECILQVRIGPSEETYNYGIKKMDIESLNGVCIKDICALVTSTGHTKKVIFTKSEGEPISFIEFGVPENYIPEEKVYVEITLSEISERMKERLAAKKIESYELNKEAINETNP